MKRFVSCSWNRVYNWVEQADGAPANGAGTGKRHPLGNIPSALVGYVSGFSLVLVAQVVLDLELLLLLIGLVFLIIAGVIAVVEARRRLKTDETSSVPAHSLEHYQGLRDQGLLDPHEFERIRSLLQRGPEPPTPPTDP